MAVDAFVKLFTLHQQLIHQTGMNDLLLDALKYQRVLSAVLLPAVLAVD